jgi:hypothetical protein
MHRGAWFAATDRSYEESHAPVGAVIGREKDNANWLMHRGAWFAATDRSYEESHAPVGAVIGREKDNAN